MLRGETPPKDGQIRQTPSEVQGTLEGVQGPHGRRARL